MRKRTELDLNFHAALRWHVDRLKHGEMKKIEIDAGLSSGYLGHMASGRRAGSERVRRAVVKALGKTYEDFLAFGAQLRGLPVEQTPEVAVNIGLGLPRAHGGYLLKARALLEGPKAEALKVVIDSMHDKDDPS